MTAYAMSSMCAALGANGPAQDIPRDSDFYGWLVGAWELEVLDCEGEGMHRVNSGEWHFAWVLEGRAIQDVLIAPKLSQRRSDIPLRGNRFGTGLRVYEAAADRWRAFWVNPMQGAIATLTVEKRGDEIVETGDDLRNVFTALGHDAFRCRVEKATRGGWTKIAQIEARRSS
ncbi:MAG: hypothetical protein WBQ17_00155 [Rhizomicrobium sp.]